MAGMTTTQNLRFGEVGDPMSHTILKDLANDIATQLDAADALRTAALKRPIARAFRATALSLPASVMTVVPMVTETTDTHNMIDIATQPTRITVSAEAGTGTYVLHASISFLYTGWTRGDIAIYRNGVFYAQRTWQLPQDLDTLQLATAINLPNVGDYVSMYVYHEGGGTMNGDQFNIALAKNST